MNLLHVHTPTGHSGTLAREADQYQFVYGAGASSRDAVSLTMPIRALAYQSHALLPIFQMNQPEGFLRERLRHLLAKSVQQDPALVMAALPGSAAIGRVFLSAPAGSATPGQASLPVPPDTPGETLQQLISHPGAQGLFDTLLERYLHRSAVSGVQPKVLVPERSEPESARATAITSEFIVKSGLSEFPGLTVNEFVCMQAVKRAGIPCPDFYLSDDQQLFIMRRFDRTADGSPVGFEDMAVLCGLSADEKYQGSYERVARALIDNCSPGNITASLHQLFDMVAISCILGNGDAHLKNFGVLYASPDADDVRLAPAYDIVNTTCYLPQDALALSLDGQRSLFASRLGLLSFGKTCRLTAQQTHTRVRHLIGCVHDTLQDLHDLAHAVPGLLPALDSSVTSFHNTFKKAP